MFLRPKLDKQKYRISSVFLKVEHNSLFTILRQKENKTLHISSNVFGFNFNMTKIDEWLVLSSKYQYAKLDMISDSMYYI